MICVALLLAGFGGVNKGGNAAEDSLVITNVSVINPETGEVLENRNVAVSKGRITEISVNTGESTNVSRAKVLIDGTGKFLIPGLIDGHVHTGSMAGMSFDQSKKYSGLTKAYFEQQPRSYLYFGFTTVVDLNSDQSSLEKFIAGEMHPDLFHCGQALILEDGYPAVFAPRGVRKYVFPNLLYDSRKDDHVPGVAADENTVEKAIARVKASGAIAVKTFHEDGFGRPIWPVPSEEMMREIRAESQRQGLKLIVHANSYASYMAVIKTGADALAHGMWNWDQFADEEMLIDALKEPLDQMISAGMAQIGTLQTIVGLRDLFDEGFLDCEAVKKALPPDYLAWLKSPEGGWFRETLVQDFPPGMSTGEIRQIYERAINHGRMAQLYFYLNGGTILFGSDTPSGPLATNVPGYNDFLELRQMAETGISLKDILKSATINNARFFGLEEDYGSIEAGKIANMLLLTHNPLQSVEAYNTIDKVILHGRVINREELAAGQNPR